MPLVSDFPASHGGGDDGGDETCKTNFGLSGQLAGLISQNDKTSKRVNSMNAKLMHQRSIHLKRLAEFVYKTKNKLSAIYEAACAEMDKSLEDRQEELKHLQALCMERAFKLIGLQDSVNAGVSITPREIDGYQQEFGITESTLDSLSIFDLVISPSMAGFYHALEEDKQPVYARFSPLYPQDVEMSIQSPLKMTTTAKIVTVIAKPSRPEFRLAKLLTATLEKVQWSGRGQAASSPGNEVICGDIVQVADGSIHISFKLSAVEHGDAGGNYFARVNLYGRPVMNSPMEIRVCPHSDTVEIISVGPRQSHPGGVSSGLDEEQLAGNGESISVLLSGLSASRPPVPQNVPGRVESADGMVTVSFQNYGEEAPRRVESAGGRVTVSIQNYGQTENKENCEGAVPRPRSPPFLPQAALTSAPSDRPLAASSAWENNVAGVARVSTYIGVGRGSFRSTVPVVPGNETIAPKPSPVDNSDVERDDEKPTEPPNQSGAVSTRSIIRNVPSSYFSPMPQVRIPNRISETQASFGAVDEPGLLDQSFSSSNDAEEGNFGGMHDDETVDGSTSDLYRSTAMTSESDHHTDHGDVAATRRAAYNPALLRPDLSGILGTPRSPKYVAAQMFMRFGFERTQEPPDRCFSFPIGCAKNENTGDYIICDTGHHTVKIYDNSARLKHTISSDFKRPAAAVVLGDNTFAIRDDLTIQIFSPDGQFLRSTPHQPRSYGLATDSQGKLLTLELGGRRDQSHVLQIEPSNCVVINRIDFVAHIGKHNSKCRFLDCFNDILYVSDLGASLIYCMPLRGDHYGRPFEFGTFGRTPGQFNEPSGISIDRNGNLFIGDSRNDRIEIFSGGGEYMGVVKVDYPIKRPSGIRLTADGNLLIMNYLQHYVALFKLKGA